MPQLIPVTVSDYEVILAHADRAAVSTTWPDGSLDFLRQPDGTYRTWAADGGTGILRTSGTLDDIAALGSHAGLISGTPGAANYPGGGGAAVVNPVDGSLFAASHLERWPGADPTRFWGSLGIIRSVDNGDEWAHLGEVIYHQSPYNSGGGAVVQEIGGGALVQVGKWLYQYFLEAPTATPSRVFIAVARTDADAAFAAAVDGDVTPWFKWSGTAWDEDGLTGLGANLFGSETFPTGWFDVTLHAPTGTFLMSMMFSSDGMFAFDEIHICQSKDGLHWTPHEALFTDADGESGRQLIYPAWRFKDYTSARSGNGPLYLYYTSGPRWTDVDIRRRTVTLASSRRGVRGGPAAAVTRG